MLAGYAGEHVLADKGYDSQEFRQHILTLGMTPVIPPRSNRREPVGYDRHLYREKLDTRYLGFLHFTAALIWLR